MCESLDDTSAITVTRRFRDFEWFVDIILIQRLHLTLKRIFPSVVVVAGLPSKWFDGLEKRRGELQRYLNALCRHPLVRSSEVFMIFLWSCGGEYEIGKSQYEAVLAGEVGDKTANFFKRVYEIDLTREGVDRREVVKNRKGVNFESHVELMDEHSKDLVGSGEKSCKAAEGMCFFNRGRIGNAIC
jgi:hypothetical protein